MRAGVLKAVAGLGILVHLGFGVWHFFVPRAHDWFAYIPDAPAELVNAIAATNFFLAASLVLLALGAVAVVLWGWGNARVVTLALGVLAALWAARAVWQIFRPQGTMIPGVAPVLVVVFLVTAACYAVPAVLVHHSV